MCSTDESEQTCHCCCRSWTRCKLVMKGIFARFLFFGYIFACLIFTIVVYVLTLDPDSGYGGETGDKIFHGGSYFIAAIVFCILALVAILIESCVTLCCHKRGEWTRLSPIMLILLIGSLPQLGILESVKINIRELQLEDCEDYTDDQLTCFGEQKTCFDQVCGESKLHPLTEQFERALLAYEQTLVVLLVLGRWFLPRGGMTREKLSDMLFAFIGMALDILDFLTTGLLVDEISCNTGKSILVLLLTTLSLFQFTFNLDLFIGYYHMKKRMQKRKIDDSKSGQPGKLMNLLQNPEARTILMNMGMQEAPFFFFRLYLLGSFVHDIDDQQSLIFFMTKNLLVLALQSYRLWIVLRDESISSDKLTRMIDHAGEHAQATKLPLDKDFAIWDVDDELAMVLTLDKKNQSETIEIAELKNMIKNYHQKLLINEDIDLGNGKILSLREKTEDDKKLEKNLGGHDNNVFTIEQGSD
ncbi:transmembrane protein 26-like [Amphiura filiformis]|uniref:transmembrane protein 26-like n=1 Tax=Amphiura filiformis TaxID=82378 RepID=UPI003B20DC81